jgi:prepilin-type N-terminal cleavage/methylation domain-containing protein
MKHLPLRVRKTNSTGFTLVELLVVIAIIAILAATILGIGNGVINSAKRVKAQNTATQIQTAVLNFFTEYSIYPMPPATTTDFVTSTQTQWQPMTVCLCGGIDPGNPGGGQYGTQTIPNTRQIPYLSFNRADLDTTSTPAVPKLPFTGPGSSILYFQMAIDGDYSNIVGDNPATAAPPDFGGTLAGVTSTTYSAPSITGGTPKAIAAGVAVWGDADPNTTTTTTNPKLWVKTY